MAEEDDLGYYAAKQEDFFEQADRRENLQHLRNEIKSEIENIKTILNQGNNFSQFYLDNLAEYKDTFENILENEVEPYLINSPAGGQKHKTKKHKTKKHKTKKHNSKKRKTMKKRRRAH